MYLNVHWFLKLYFLLYIFFMCPLSTKVCPPPEMNCVYLSECWIQYLAWCREPKWAVFTLTQHFMKPVCKRVDFCSRCDLSLLLFCTVSLYGDEHDTNLKKKCFVVPVTYCCVICVRRSDYCAGRRVQKRKRWHAARCDHSNIILIMMYVIMRYFPRTLSV